MTDIENIGDLDTAKRVMGLLAQENERLHRRLQELARDIARLQGRGEGEQMALEFARLQEQLNAALRREFGDSSEKRSKPRTEKEPKKPKKGHGPREQPSLPIREVVETLPEDACSCPKCGNQLKPMAGITEDSEYITRIERKYEVIRERRQKYRCQCNEAVVTAPSAALKVSKGGRYDLLFAVGVVVDKYVDHSVPRRHGKEAVMAA